MENRKCMFLGLVILASIGIGTLPADAARQKLRMLTWEGPYMKKIAQEFAKRNPDIDVQVDATPFEGYYDKILTALAAGSTYDIYQMGEVDIGRYVYAGFAEPLNKFIKGDKTDLTGLSKGVRKAYTINGNLYGLPKDYAPYGFFYNKRLFDQAGVSYPQKGWTWDDMQVMGKKLTKYDGSTNKWTQEGYAQWWGVAELHVFTTTFGAGFMAPDKEQFAGYLNSPATAKALQLMVDLRNKDKMYYDNWPFQNGKVGMYLDGSFRVAQCKSSKMKDYGVVPPPIGKQAGGVMYTSGFMMSPASKKKDAAWKLIKFIGGPEGNLMTANAINTVPCWQSAIKELKFDTDPVMSALIDAGEDSILPSPANHPFYQKILGKYVYDAFVQQCFQNPKKTVPQFLEEVTAICDREYAAELKRKTHSVR